jgi:drug/metabolite transporter (DMT)-like permease
LSRRDLLELFTLGALWGASFLFMRLGAADFGPLALVFLRVAGATLVLLPLLVANGQAGALRQHWRAIAMVGVFNSALPFLLFSAAALVLSAALMSMINATASIWGALIAWAWMGDRPTASRAWGLAIGIAGVVGLAWGKADFKANDHGLSPALGIAACVGAAVLYGLGANVSRRYLAKAPPLTVAAGSQICATAVMAIPAALYWPQVNPGLAAWASVAALAFACTGLAYLLYFRLIAHAGATNAMSVTFLIPAFAMAFSWSILGEQPTVPMLVGGVVVLLGTGLATGAVRWPVSRAAPIKEAARP